jgi:hypothetical protein
MVVAHIVDADRSMFRQHVAYIFRSEVGGAAMHNKAHMDGTIVRVSM